MKLLVKVRQGRRGEKCHRNCNEIQELATLQSSSYFFIVILPDTN